jgi:hypothetical protein
MKRSELKKQIEDNIIELLTVTPGSNKTDVLAGSKQQGISDRDASAALDQANKTKSSVTLTGKSSTGR